MTELHLHKPNQPRFELTFDKMENIRKSEKKQQTETCALWLKIRMPKRNAKFSTIIHTPTHSNHQFWGQSFRFRSPPGILYAYTLCLHSGYLSLLLLNKAAGEELLPNHCLHQGIANSQVPGMEMTHNSSQRLAFKVRTGDCRNFDLWHKTICEKSDSQLHTSDNTYSKFHVRAFGFSNIDPTGILKELDLVREYRIIDTTPTQVLKIEKYH